MKRKSSSEIRSIPPVGKLCFAVIAGLCVAPFAALAQSEASVGAREEAALTTAAEKVAPSVVQIRTIGGLDVVEGTILADGPTTGLVISADGYILSSAFNFVQKPASILVTFASGKQAPAELVATDHSRMFVLLKATGVADLPVPSFTPVNEIRVGQWATAIGRTFRADRTNVTVGIVSALNRMFGKAIQTDADISTTNYGGPLADIQGRVLGVLVPMAPQASSEVAGVEWYDSGIGFAVPIAPLAERIAQMKKGKDQRSGLLGIGMKPDNPHSSPAELAVVRPDSPAGKAGFKKGDKIAEFNGKPIHSQTDLRFAMGTLYGGDTVHVVAMRGDERIERDVKLVAELPAFRHAFLGLLPLREAPKDAGKEKAQGEAKDAKNSKVTQPGQDSAAAKGEQTTGIGVRMVYADSPAAQAGIKPGDRITKINESQIHSVDDAIQAVNNVTAEAKVAVQVLREEKLLDLTLTASQLPTDVPNDLPPARKPQANDVTKGAPPGTASDFRLPEFPHSCRIYVPADSSPRRELGVVLWIQSSADGKPDETIRKWQAICDRDGIIFVIPTAKDADHWERTDLEYLHRLLQQVTAKYQTDSRRIVVGGAGNVGAIAWPLALTGRASVRGVIAIATMPPRQLRILPNDPARRLAIFAAIPPKKDVAAAIGQSLKTVSDAGYNVSTLTTNDITGNLNELNLEEISRWIDTLDRF
jgi:serine protease Do